ncbi:MAG: CHAD domain-containing protein, partial [Bacteroidota bacterium]
MNLQIEKGETFAFGIFRIFHGLLDDAVERLSDQDHKDETIHEVRKDFKKIRALLRISRYTISKNFYRENNVFFRELAKKLAYTRTSKVHLQTLNKLLENKDLLEKSTGLKELELYLKKLHEKNLVDLKENKIFEKIRKDLIQKKREIKEWPVKSRKKTKFYKGILEMYKKGQKRKR